MKVYIVTAEEFCGERRIVKVLSERADANKLVDMSNEFDDYRIEEWTVDEHPAVHIGEVWHGHYRLADDHYRVTTTKYKGFVLEDAELLDKESGHVTVWGMDEKAVANFLYEQAQKLKAEHTRI